MGALRILLVSLRTALAHPRVWLAAWVVVTVPALLAVYPVARQLHDAIGTHPGASLGVDQALDADFARLHPDAVVRLGGALVFVLFAFAFLGGGIQACVGTGQRFAFGAMLIAGARLFLRSVRVLLLGALACALVFWGTDALDRWIRLAWLYESDPGALRLLGIQSPWLTRELALEALRWLWGLLFLGVVFVTKMAMARLAVLDRRSAVLAWLAAVGAALRRPLRFWSLVALWTATWFAVMHVCGMLTTHLLEVEGEPWLGLAAGQLGILWTQVVLVAAFLAARELAVPSVVVAGRRASPESAEPRSESDASL